MPTHKNAQNDDSWKPLAQLSETLKLQLGTLLHGKSANATKQYQLCNELQQIETDLIEGKAILRECVVGSALEEKWVHHIQALEDRRFQLLADIDGLAHAKG